MNDVGTEHEVSDKASLCIGTISEYNPSTGTVRVLFDEDDDDGDGNAVQLVSFQMPILFRKSQNDKETHPFDIGEQVACLINWEVEQGVCLGALYNNVDAPDGPGVDIHRILFKDGSFETFDRSAGDRALSYKGEYSLATGNGAKHDMDDKHKIYNNSDSLKSIMSDLLSAIEQMTFANGGGVTAQPINLLSFQNIGTRINNLLA